SDWTKYFNVFLKVFFGPEWQVPRYLSSETFSSVEGAWFSLPAVIIMAPAPGVPVIRIPESAPTTALLLLVQGGAPPFVICRRLPRRVRHPRQLDRHPAPPAQARRRLRPAGPPARRPAGDPEAAPPCRQARADAGGVPPSQRLAAGRRIPGGRGRAGPHGGGG